MGDPNSKGTVLSAREGGHRRVTGMGKNGGENGDAQHYTFLCVIIKQQPC